MSFSATVATPVKSHITRSACDNIPRPANRHIAFDGYSVASSKLLDQPLMQSVLDFLNRDYFSGAGQAHVIAMSGEALTNPIDEGLLGYVVSERGHIACRTHPYRGLIIADIYTAEARSAKVRTHAVDCLLKAYTPSHHSMCEGIASRAKYGKHAIFIWDDKMPQSETETALASIKSNLQLRPAGETITLSYEDSGYDIFTPLWDGFIAVHADQDEAMLELFSAHGLDPSVIRRSFLATQCYFIAHGARLEDDSHIAMDAEELARTSRRAAVEFVANSRQVHPRQGGGIK